MCSQKVHVETRIRNNRLHVFASNVHGNTRLTLSASALHSAASSLAGGGIERSILWIYKIKAKR